MKLLGISGSLRRDSHNSALIRAAAGELPPGWELEIYDGLADVPPFDEDLDAAGAPPAVESLRIAIADADAVLFATPEYNASVPALLKNTLDWMSRVKDEPNVFTTRVFAISGTSPGYYGAMRSLLQLREILSVGRGATVIPQQMALPRSMQAFAEDGSLKDDNQQKMFAGVVEALAVAARKFAA